MDRTRPGHRRPSGGPGSRPGEARLTAGRCVPRLRHHPARRCPAGGHHLFGGRQDRRRHAARRARGRVHRGRLAGRHAQGHRVLRQGPLGGVGICAPRPLVAFGATRKAGVRAQDDQQVQGAARLRRRGDHPGGQVRRPARGAGPAHHAGREPGHGLGHRAAAGGQRPPGVPGLRALLRRVPVRPRLRPAGAGGRRHRRRRRRRACATPTAACCRCPSNGSSGRSGTAPDSGSASTARTTPAARWPTPSPPSRPAPPTCSARPTATASGRAMPTCSRWSAT